MTVVTITLTDGDEGRVKVASQMSGDAIDSEGELSPTVRIAALINAMGECGIYDAIGEMGVTYSMITELNRRREAAGQPVSGCQLSAADVARVFMMLGFFDKAATLAQCYVDYRKVMEEIKNDTADPVAAEFFASYENVPAPAG